MWCFLFNIRDFRHNIRCISETVQDGDTVTVERYKERMVSDGIG